MEIVVVGPCGAGKSTLVQSLRARGYVARAVAQEHSIISALWRHGGEPAALIVLEVERDTIAQRRGAEFPDWLYEEQRGRLASARAHADLIVPTDGVLPEQVTQQVVNFLHSAGITAESARQ